MCTYKHMHTLHTHTYTLTHVHTSMCALNTLKIAYMKTINNNLYTSANSMPTHTLTSAQRSPAYDHELTTPYLAAWEDQLLKCCGMH